MRNIFSNFWWPCKSNNFIEICNFIEIVLRHGCSPVNLLSIFRTHCSRNTSGWLLLNLYHTISWLSEALEYQQAFLFYSVFLYIKLLGNKFFSFSQWTFQSVPSDFFWCLNFRLLTWELYVSPKNQLHSWTANECIFSKTVLLLLFANRYILLAIHLHMLLIQKENQCEMV